MRARRPVAGPPERAHGSGGCGKVGSARRVEVGDAEEKEETQMASSRVEVGATAPVFALPDQNGKEVSLSDFAGSWVVLYFYPKDDTPGCTTEACEFTDGIKAFERLDAVVLGCSADTPESHRKFIAKHGLKVTLLSDADRAVMKTYAAWGEKNLYGRTTMGVIRSTVLIDPRGKVAFRWPNVKAAGHAEQVREKLAELQGG
jgi:peroxiredoxin Q/BCP